MTERGPHQGIKYLKGGRGWTRLCSVVLHNRAQGTGQKLIHRKFHLNTRRNFFTAQVTTHWNRFSIGDVESPSLVALLSCVDAFLCHVL